MIGRAKDIVVILQRPLPKIPMNPDAAKLES